MQVVLRKSIRLPYSVIMTTQGSLKCANNTLKSYISPHSVHQNKQNTPITTSPQANIPVIFTASFGLLFGPVGTFSILRNVSMPSMTFPKTTCFPSRKSHGAVVTKNYKVILKKMSGGGEG